MAEGKKRTMVADPELQVMSKAVQLIGALEQDVQVRVMQFLNTRFQRTYLVSNDADAKKLMGENFSTEDLKGGPMVFIPSATKKDVG